MSRSRLVALLFVPLAFMLMGANAVLVDPEPIAVPAGIACEGRRQGDQGRHHPPRLGGLEGREQPDRCDPEHPFAHGARRDSVQRQGSGHQVRRQRQPGLSGKERREVHPRQLHQLGRATCSPTSSANCSSSPSSKCRLRAEVARRCALFRFPSRPSRLRAPLAAGGARFSKPCAAGAAAFPATTSPESPLDTFIGRVQRHRIRAAARSGSRIGNAATTVSRGTACSRMVSTTLCIAARRKYGANRVAARAGHVDVEHRRDRRGVPASRARRSVS